MNNKLPLPQIFGESNIGLTRKENEDSFFYQVLREHGLVMAAVADGVGGHIEGAMASNLVCQYIAAQWLNGLNLNLARQPHEAERCALNLVQAIHGANQDLYARNVYKQISAPSSSTVVAAIIDESRVRIWHVGDSRFYCCRDGALTQVTRDHTIVRKLQDAGVVLTPEIQKQYGHIISRAIGPGNNVEVEDNELERRPGDRYLLCSDGLSNMVKFDRIQEIMTQVNSARECNCELMRQALIGGGTDNVTVVSIFS